MPTESLTLVVPDSPAQEPDAIGEGLVADDRAKYDCAVAARRA